MLAPDLVGRVQTVRAKDWKKTGEIMDFLAEANMQFGMLGYGCLEVSNDAIDKLKRKGYDMQKVDFESVVNDKKYVEAYIAHYLTTFGFTEIK
jgi:sugar phosphate isomerase/epimerase